MTVPTDEPGTSHPVLLCFDGSDDAAAAIARAAEVLGPRNAVVLTVWERAGVGTSEAGHWDCAGQ